MIRLLAPAKLNLYLRVLGRRPDGYHELETLFERIDLADELTFTPQERGITVTCDDSTLACGESNLVTKAATLLRQTCGVSQGATIHLTKRIPVAAGLGGGSSDAATTLIGLNRLWGLPLPISRLRELGAQLGADVPVFFEQAPFVMGRGRGDACELVAPPWPTLWHVLVVPPARLSTKDVYEGFDRSTLTTSRPFSSIVLHALRNGSLRELAEGFVNDLQPEAIRRCPVIQDIQGFLQSYPCLGTMVSGSGPSVFGLCQDQSQAEAVSQRLHQVGDPSWRMAVVHTLSTDSDDDTR